MKTILAKILINVILFAFLFNLSGYIVIFNFYQYVVRNEIKQKIKLSVPENQLNIIKFEKNQKIPWVKKGKEFIYNGNMYDVVRTENINNQTIFYCILDFKETELFANLDLQVKRNIGSNTEKNQKINFLLKQLIKVVHISKHYPNEQNLFYSYINWDIKNFILCFSLFEIKTPPPEVSIV